MDEQQARSRFAAARVAHLATARPDGSPHVIPVVFALEHDVVWLAVDEKPKRTRALQRLKNIEREPRVAVLVDAYSEDWTRLWWVRADGRGRVTDDPAETARAAALLGAKYAQHAARPPGGPAIAIDVDRFDYWSAK